MSSAAPLMAPPYACACAFASSRAKSRDAAAVWERDDVLVVLVADGGGGLRDGAAASTSLVAVVQAAVRDSTFALDKVQPWLDLFRATDLGLVANRAGETTAVVIVLGPWGLLGLSIGDSEAWVITPDGTDNLTVGQHTQHRLGTKSGSIVIFQRSTLAGVLVLGSDGLFKYASMQIIADVVRDCTLGQAAEQLVELVRQRSGKVAEDVAVVCVQRRARPTAVA
jgi:serine/threonine protein phosphatase PrpC